MERQVAAHLGIALNALQEQADLHAHHRAHHIDQAVALIRGDTASLKVTLVRVAIRHAPVGHRLDAAHNDGLEVQKLNAHALVDLERNARRIGTVGNQSRGRMERSSIGVLVLETTGVGHQAAQQASRDAITGDNATIVQEAVDNHSAGCSFDAPQLSSANSSRAGW